MRVSLDCQEVYDALDPWPKEWDIDPNQWSITRVELEHPVLLATDDMCADGIFDGLLLSFREHVGV